jgi:hypothetical protein
MELIRSDPTTNTVSAVPVAINPSPMFVAKMNPAHAALMSNAADRDAPISA